MLTPRYRGQPGCSTGVNDIRPEKLGTNRAPTRTTYLLRNWRTHEQAADHPDCRCFCRDDLQCCCPNHPGNAGDPGCSGESRCTESDSGNAGGACCQGGCAEDEERESQGRQAEKSQKSTESTSCS